MLDEFRSFDTDEREDIEDESTIQDTIDVGSMEEMTYYNTSLLNRIDDEIEYATSNIIDDYIEELDNASTEYEMTDEEYEKYCMRPDLFCYDLYNNINVDFIIMLINGINDEKEFTNKTIKYINPEYMDEILSYILNAEEECIQMNRENL